IIVAWHGGGNPELAGAMPRVVVLNTLSIGTELAGRIGRPGDRIWEHAVEDIQEAEVITLADPDGLAGWVHLVDHGSPGGHGVGSVSVNALAAGSEDGGWSPHEDDRLSADAEVPGVVGVALQEVPQRVDLRRSIGVEGP